jgi:pimeloyl-ACP methyl ester carboxylesterase
MARWRRGASVLLLLSLGLVASCSGGDDGARPVPGSSGRSATKDTTTAPTPDLTRFYRQHLTWHGCGGHFECTKLVVPVDYTHPTGPTVKIAVNRLKASGDRIGSLLVNPGGPGVSGVQYARAATQIVDGSIRRHYDIVGFDPRGIGASEPLHCLTDKQVDAFLAYDGTPDDAAEEQGLVHQGQLLAAGCEKDDAQLLAHIGTRDVARDLDVLRAALGDRKLSYLGASYGTYLGATYAELFPKRVGRLVLDGAYDPAATADDVARVQAAGFERALAAFLDDCLGRSSCPYDGSRAAADAKVRALVESLDAHPLPGVGHRTLTQSLGVLGIVGALYDKGSWSFLRDALDEAGRGDGTSLMLLADSYAYRGPGGHYTSNVNEVSYAVLCVDRPQDGNVDTLRADAAKAATVSPLFGPYIVWANIPCTTWPVPAEGKAAPVHAAGAAPILVVGTTRDPATPYEWAQAMARELDSGHLLTRIGDGHTAYRQGSSCIDAAIDAYLLEGKVPAEGTRCH